MGISGNLKTMALAELLQWLAEGRKTGTLRIDNGSTEKRIFFFEGKVISTSSSDPKEHLGHFLVSHGFMTENELAKAVEMQETNKMLLGKILTTIGVITEEDLDQMLRLKSQESVYDLFSWPEAEFNFLDDELPEGTLVPIDLDVTSLILRGTQRVDEWQRIRDHIPSSQAVPVSVRELVSEDPTAQAVLEAIDDDRSIAEIAMHTHSGEYHVCRILIDQVESGALKIVRPRGPVQSTNAIEDVVSVDALLTKADQLMAEGSFMPALRHLRAAKSLEPDDRKIQKTIQETEQNVRRQLEEAGIQLDSVPRVSEEIEDFNALDINPDQGFILSRINGSMDIQTILKISPMHPLDAQLVFLQLRDAGYITLQ